MNKITEQAFLEFDKLVNALMDNCKNWEEQFNILNRLIILKPALWSAPLMSFDKTIREKFFENLYELDFYMNRYISCIVGENNIDDNDSLKTWIGFCKCIFNTYSNVLPAISQIWLSDNPFHISCGNCGNDLHSIVLSSDAVPENIKCRTLDNTESTELPAEEWNVFFILMPFLNALGETQLSAFLSQLYGTHRCTVCGKEECILESHMNWCYNSHLLEEPENALIDWLIEYGDTQLNESYQKMLFFHKMALYYAHSQRKPEPVYLAKALLKVSTDNTFLFKYSIQIAYAKQTVDLLESSDTAEYYKNSDVDSYNEWQSMLGEAYRRLGYAYCSDFEHEENNSYDLAMECYNTAIKIFDAALGEGNDKTELVQKNIAILTLDMNKENQKSASDSIGILKKQIKEERQKENPDYDKIADTYKIIASLYADKMNNYKKAIHYYEYYIKQIKVKYGDESDIVADCYESIAKYYEANGDLTAACEYCEHALQINIREMGRIFLLPPVFKDILVNILTKSSQIDEDDKYMRCLSASGAYRHVGELYLQMGQTKKAMQSFNRAFELYDWVMIEPTLEKGKIYQFIGDTYKQMGDIKQAEKNYITAINIYEKTAETNSLRDNKRLYESETSECLKEREKLMQQLNSISKANDL